MCEFVGITARTPNLLRFSPEGVCFSRRGVDANRRVFDNRPGTRAGRMFIASSPTPNTRFSP
ncbi:MAG: hypothetical protein M3Y56_03950 [Armatimonadota bacterium]|nr:hypothetical protein [Armatimonadota bacterium]